MKTSFYPVLMCSDIQKEATLFKEVFKFKEVYTSSWYLSLQDDDGFEIAMIDCTHETIPQQYRKSCEGIILNIEVNDVDAIYNSIVMEQKMPILLDIRNEEYGQRHFMMETPSNILLDIIQMIPSSK